MRFRSILVPVVLILGASLAACGGSGDELPPCPKGGTDLTYESFGQTFFDTYCTGCHSPGSGISEAEEYPFDSQAGIQAEIDEIYQQAGGSHTTMPPSGADKPSPDEREQLAEWLSCGAK